MIERDIMIGRDIMKSIVSVVLATIVFFVGETVMAVRDNYSTELVIIAAGQFQESRFSLPSAVNDAACIRRLFDRGESTRCHELVSGGLSEPTLANSLTLFRNLAECTDSKSRLIIYISSHGYQSEDGYRLLMGDSLVTFDDQNRIVSATDTLSLTELAHALESIPAREVIVFIDACFSGAAKESFNLKDIFEAGERQDRSLYVFCSAAGDQYSQVCVWEDISLFTYYMSASMCLGDANNDGRVSVDEMYDYMCDRVRKVSEAQTITAVSAKGDKSTAGKTLVQIPSRFVSSCGSVPTFLPLTLTLDKAMLYMSQGIYESLIINRLDNCNAAIREFRNSKNSQEVLGKNSLGKVLASTLGKNMEKMIKIENLPINKAITVTKNEHHTDDGPQSNANAITISGNYQRFLNPPRLLVRSEVSTDRGTVAVFTTNILTDELDCLDDTKPVEPKQTGNSVTPSIPKTCPLPVSVTIDRQTGDGVFVQAYSTDSSESYLKVQQNDVLRINVENRSAHEKIGVIVLVDGLNILALAEEGEKERLASPLTHIRNARYWILDKGVRNTFRGWYILSDDRVNEEAQVAELKVVDPPKSLAIRANAVENLGEIRVLVYRLARKKTGTRSVGIGAGVQSREKVDVDFEYYIASETPVSNILIRYCEE